VAPLTLVPPGGGPHAAALGVATRAFNRGDFRRVGATARGVLAAADATDAERSFAAELSRRTAVDSAACAVGGAVGLLLAALWILPHLIR
jgi:hypothetical protein